MPAGWARSIAWLLLLGVLGACQPAGAPAGSRPAATAAPPVAPATGTARATPEARQTVKVGTVGSFTDAGFAIGIARGYYAQQGLDISVERLDSAARMIPFVSTGQLDVAGGGPSAGLFQALARGVELRIVADKGSASEQDSYFCFLVRKDLLDSGRVRSEADLRGLTIAAAAPGNSVELATHRLLAAGGLSEGDVTFVNMSYQDMHSALATGRIDVASTLEPVCAQAVADQVAVRWRTTADYHPRQTIATVFYSPQFAAQTEAATRFMVAYLQGVRDYRRAYLEKDAALRAQLDPIMAEWTGIDPRVYDGMVLPELAADGSINVASIEELQDFFWQSGQIPERADLRRFVDDRFREEAVRRLAAR
ncbi:MAG: ABC transporter substrate-binding protein [Chloroflexi bacterium]|nr:ABC transporter substrate-binding protein [Chloroflexota bacterium]